jgi:hypothetical protein
MTFTLYSWGAKFTMQGYCQNGMLYGFVGGDGIVVVTLKEQFSKNQ